MKLLLPSIYQVKFDLGKLSEYFKRMCFGDRKERGQLIFMMPFPKEEWVPGGSWPGGYGRICITDFSKYKQPIGRKKVTISDTEYKFVDSPDMHKLVTKPLKSKEDIRKEELEYNRTSIYNFPYRFHQKYLKQLLVKINGSLAQDQKCKEWMIKEMISEMSEKEIAEYKKKIDRVCYSNETPSIELPVKIRIDGIDDGAEEILVESIEVANKILTDLLKSGNNQKNRRAVGFISTD